MSAYDFDTPVRRSGAGTLKAAMTPETLTQNGLLSYWGAEFEFQTCPAFSEGVRTCAERGLYGFTIQNEAYNRRVVWWMEHVRGFACDPAWIVPTHGTIFALATALRLFCLSAHKRLLVLLPGYNRYAQAASRMNLATDSSTMLLGSDGVYRINWEDLEQHMADPANGLLAFSNPNNPTGMILSRDELERIGLLSEKYSMPVFCDEIFAEVTRGQKVFPYIGIERGRDLAMTCTSLGKCMSLTGVNHANLLLPDAHLRERYISQKYADHYGSLDPMLYAGLMQAYTEQGADFVRALNQVIDRNLQLLKDRLPGIVPGSRVLHPTGTFVVFVDYRGAGLSDDELAQALQEKGLFYGDDGADYGVSRQFYRYNLAVPTACLAKSLDYLEAHWNQPRG